MTNYQKGANKERKIVNQARSEGKIAFRSAGSHSPIDVCVIDTQKRIIKLIQSKAYKLSDNAISKLYESNRGLNGDYKVIFEVN